MRLPTQPAPSSLGRLNVARWQACLIALASTIATMAIRLALSAQLGAEPALVLFMVPILIGAYFGGLLAGIVATVLCYLLSSYFLLEPLHSFRVSAVEQQWNVGFFLAAGLGISILSEAVHRGRARDHLAAVERKAEVLRKLEAVQKADILELKKAEALLRSTNKEISDLKTALDEHCIVAITDCKGKIVYVNDKFCALSQYSRDELMGRDHRVINSGTHSKEFIRGIWDSISAGRVWKGEIKNRAKDGSFYWVETTIAPNLGPDGNPQQYVSIRTDITGRKQSEEASRQLNGELEIARLLAEKANRAKSDFLSSMSHELRSPLNGIIGFTEFLMDEKPGPLRAKQKEYLGDVLNSGRHLLQLINDVLDLSKIEAGKMELHPEVFAVGKAAAEVAAVVQGIAQKKHIVVEIQIGVGLEAVVLDQHKFKQMLYNLLSNAVKFSDDDGRVELHARCLDPQWFEVSVRDTGIGIKADDMGRLFGKFEQLDAGAARRFEGTGLGLALTKNIVEFQGGRITVESEPGKGSLFTVVLPTLTENRRAA